MSAFHWVANGTPKVTRDNLVVVLADGEYVPEAAGWKDPELWERTGYIRKVAGAPPAMPGGDGCHVHDLHEGKCSRCDFVEVPKALPAVPPVPPKVPEPPSEIEPESTPEVEAASEPIVLERAEGVSELFEPQDLNPVPTVDDDIAAPSEDEAEFGGVGTDDEEVEDDEEEYEAHTQSELKRMRKAELQGLAVLYDIIPGKASKGELIDLIMEAEKTVYAT